MFSDLTARLAWINWDNLGVPQRPAAVGSKVLSRVP